MRAARILALIAAGLAFAVFLWGAGGTQPALDVYFSDRYYVIAKSHVALAAALICGLFTLTYFILRKRGQNERERG